MKALLEVFVINGSKNKGLRILCNHCLVGLNYLLSKKVLSMSKLSYNISVAAKCYFQLVCNYYVLKTKEADYVNLNPTTYKLGTYILPKPF